MTRYTVIGLPGSSADLVAERLGDAFGERVRPSRHVAGSAADTGAVVFVDDAPPSKEPADAARADALESVAAARAAGRRVHVLRDWDAAKRWLGSVERDTFGAPVGPIRRVFLASGGSEESHRLASLLAFGLGLPLVEPEPSKQNAPRDGWGPRYAAIAAEDSWLVHTPLWHAVEYLAPRADLVVHVGPGDQATAREFPAPEPAARPVRLALRPWLRRYPRVEAGLLERELKRYGESVPILRLRTAAEVGAVTRGLTSAAAVGP